MSWGKTRYPFDCRPPGKTWGLSSSCLRCVKLLSTTHIADPEILKEFKVLPVKTTRMHGGRPVTISGLDTFSLNRDEGVKVGDLLC